VACSGTDLAFYENRAPRRLLEPERERKLQDDGGRDMREREEEVTGVGEMTRSLVSWGQPRAAPVVSML
jgi:hypothetical protein